MVKIGRFTPFVIYSATVGILYGIYGVGGLLTSVGQRIPLPLMSKGGIPLSLLMLLISTLYLYHLPDLNGGRIEGISFLLTALTLSAVSGAMFFLIIGATYLNSILLGEVFTLSSVDVNISAVFLFLLSLPLWLVFRYRKEVKG